MTDPRAHQSLQITTLSSALRSSKLSAWLENGFEKKLKNLKSSKFRLIIIFYFLVKFYTNHIKFHILIMICEYCYILQKML